jgi:CRISPR system Cascade subunit CasB
MNDQLEDSRPAEFISLLQGLDPGDRARLKRNAGKTISEAHDAMGLFYKLLPYGVSQSQEEFYFLVATLFPIAAKGNKGNFGDHLLLAQSSKNSKGLDRRVEILLDADMIQLHFRLRQSVHFLQSCRVGINWVQLLEDLLQWNHPDRYIQTRWARSYFGSNINNKDKE